MFGFGKKNQDDAYTNINGVKIFVPSSYKKIIPVSPHKKIFDFEVHTFLGLEKCIKPGDIVLDIGASYGVMSALMSKLTGKDGKVFSFEANEEVLIKAKELASVNKPDNIKFHNFLVGEKSKDEMDFYVISGFNSVASSANPEILQKNPKAIKKKITTISIDDFCDKYGIIPNCIKIDIEGSEYIAVKGMKKILEEHTPDLIIETHGAEIDGIGGSLNQLIQLLESFEYSFFDLKRGNMTTRQEYTSRYIGENSTLLVSLKLRERKFVEELEAESRKLLEEFKERNDTRIKDMEISKLANSGDYHEIIRRLHELPIDSDNMEEQYYLALSLHITGLNHNEALQRYGKALENGFSPFWVYYNRGALNYRLHNIKEATDDLHEASKLDPNHEGVKSSLQSIKEKKYLSEASREFSEKTDNKN